MSEYEEVIVRLDKANTIIEGIVRCKDCRWYKDFDGCFFSTAEVEPLDYCSHGIRRSEEENVREVARGFMELVGAMADRKTEPQTENLCDGCVCDDGKHLMYCMNCKGIAWQTEPPKVETEPQTEWEKSGSRAVLTARCLNCKDAKACKENNWEGCKYETYTEQTEPKGESDA